MNESSSVSWTGNYGSTSTDVAHSLVETSDGGFALAGYTRDWDNPGKDDDFWLVKTDANGNMEWNQTYDNGFHETARSLVETSDGGFALAGSINYVTLGRGSPPPLHDVWLVKTDEKGNVEWNKTYGGEGSDSVFSLVVTSDGGYAIVGFTKSFDTVNTGFWLVKTDSTGSLEWNQTYGGTGWDTRAKAIIQTSDGGYILAGIIGIVDDEEYDLLLIKTDANGNMEWNQTYGRLEYDGANSLVVTSDGGYAIAGYTGYWEYLEGSDFWLIKTDANGNMEWNQTYGGIKHESAHSLVVTSDGGYALFGDDLLVKTDMYGNMEWNQTYVDTGYNIYNSMVLTSDGGYAIAGSTRPFGDKRSDFWLVKTDEHGNIPELPFSP